jgi:hypothetical protein
LGLFLPSWPTRSNLFPFLSSPARTAYPRLLSSRAKPNRPSVSPTAVTVSLLATSSIKETEFIPKLKISTESKSNQALAVPNQLEKDSFMRTLSPPPLNPLINRSPRSSNFEEKLAETLGLAPLAVTPS